MNSAFKGLRFVRQAVLPYHLPVRFSIEQLSYLLIAIENETLRLRADIRDAQAMNNTLFDIGEANRRIMHLNRCHKAITESIDT